MKTEGLNIHTILPHIYNLDIIRACPSLQLNTTIIFQVIKFCLPFITT